MEAQREMTLEEIVNNLPEGHKAKKEYKKLLSDSWFLNCLQGAGVDSWNGYEEAQEMYQELGEK